MPRDGDFVGVTAFANIGIGEPFDFARMYCRFRFWPATGSGAGGCVMMDPKLFEPSPLELLNNAPPLPLALATADGFNVGFVEDDDDDANVDDEDDNEDDKPACDDKRLSLEEGGGFFKEVPA